MTDDALEWLGDILEANHSKRCFVFVHPDISSGNPLGAYTSNRLFDNWGTKTTTFKNILAGHGNVILFHGHSHTEFECQEVDPVANFSNKDSFNSVHVPSLSRTRYIENGVLSTYTDDNSQCYIVDVYEDCVVLNGLDLVNARPVPLGVYKIDTE